MPLINYHFPIVVDSLNDKSFSQTDLIITKYQYQKTKKVIDRNLYLFDFPSQVNIIIYGVNIPCKIFDFFNPLIINSKILEFISFNQSEFECYQLISKGLPENGFNLPVFYPPNFIINYSDNTIQKFDYGKQFWDVIEQWTYIIPSAPIDIGLTEYLNQLFNS